VKSEIDLDRIIRARVGVEDFRIWHAGDCQVLGIVHNEYDVILVKLGACDDARPAANGGLERRK
jgi:hypothetical protein